MALKKILLAAGDLKTLVVALLTGSLLAVSYSFWPGILYGDGESIFSQSKTGFFADMHPPVLAGLWRLFNFLYVAPSSMFLFQTVVWLAGVTLWSLLLFKKSPLLGAIFSGITLWPPVFSFIGVISKDNVHNGCLLIASGVMYGLHLYEPARRRKITTLVGAMVLLTYAVAVRWNGVFSAGPLFLWAAVLLWSSGKSNLPEYQQTLRVAVTGLALALTAFLAATFVNRSLTDRRDYPFQIVMLHDLAALAIQTQSLDLYPPYLRSRPELKQDSIARHFSLDEAFNIRGATPFSKSAENMEQLVPSWISAISTHPRAYFAHRSNVFLNQLSIRPEGACYPNYTYMVPRILDTGQRMAKRQETAGLYLKAFEHTLLFRPFLWMGLGLAAGMAAIYFVGFLHPATFVLLSGIVYQASQFLLGISCDFRYSIWLVIMDILGCLLLILALRRRKPLPAGKLV